MEHGSWKMEYAIVYVHMYIMRNTHNCIAGNMRFLRLPPTLESKHYTQLIDYTHTHVCAYILDNCFYC